MPLWGLVAFRKMGIIQRFPERWQPAIKMLHRQASRGSLARVRVVAGGGGRDYRAPPPSRMALSTALGTPDTQAKSMHAPPPPVFACRL